MPLGEILIDAGDIKLGTNLEISYVDQNRIGAVGEDDAVGLPDPGGGDSILVRGTPKHAGRLRQGVPVHRGLQLRQPVTSLSGGERNRLLLARPWPRPPT